MPEQMGYIKNNKEREAESFSDKHVDFGVMPLNSLDPISSSSSMENKMK